MSTEQTSTTSTAIFATSPHMNAVSIFVAVVLGSSLIEFNGLLFPPKLTSLAFWAILPCYCFAFDAWFGIIAWARYTPYLDKPISRTWIAGMFLAWTFVLAVMYFASRLPDSFLGYIWCLVVLFIVMWASYYFRHRDTNLPEPLILCAQFGSLALIAATVYSIWALAFPAVPDTVNWVFVFIVFAIMVGYRVMLRMTHVWRPEERHVKEG